MFGGVPPRSPPPPLDETLIKYSSTSKKFPYNVATLVLHKLELHQ